jgi:outer membrane protein OmpA-like peptidoglycan-associated protein
MESVGMKQDWVLQKANRARFVLLTLVAFLAFSVSSQANPQEVTTAEELIDKLQVKPEPAPGIRTRSIVLSAPNQDQGRVTFSSIQFEHDSANLTKESASQLIELGKALGDERLAGESFVIEGHADAYGDDDYNKDLSFRRAGTVKTFLVTNNGIDERRLSVIGRGEEDPKTNDPYDPENRRVEVINTKVY